MTVYFGDKKIKEMYWGGLKIREAWYEGQRVFSGRPVEVMPAVSGSYGARDWLRAKLTEYGEDYRTVTEIPFEIDSRQATGMYGMFRGCSSLIEAPPMDTSNVTTMREMFQSCSSLIEAPPMDTSNVTNMYQMFRGCSSLTAVPDMNTHNVTDMMYMFQSCSSLTDGNVRLIGKNSSVRTGLMTSGSGLTRNPFYDSSGRPI